MIGCGSCKVPCDALKVCADGVESAVRELARTYCESRIVKQLHRAWRSSGPCRISVCAPRGGRMRIRCIVQDLCGGQVMTGMFQTHVNQPYN